MGEEILDRPFPQDAREGQLARETNAVDEQLKLVTLAHQTREKNVFLCFYHSL